MYIKTLQLVNFKNYEEAEIDFSPAINCFVGQNGSGKTTVLDAIHYLSVCRSYLNPIDSQNIRFGENFFLLQSFWTKNEVETEIYCGVKKGQKKIVKKNKVNYEKLADHIGLFPSVMISPYDRNLILEGSELRRKWMDSIISQFDRKYLDALMRYNKVLDQRNALLKNNHSSGFFDSESFDIWDEQLISLGALIHEKRNAFLTEFIPVFQSYYNELGTLNEQVNLAYKSQLQDANFADLVLANRRKDLAVGYSTVGIHKDDLSFDLNEYPIKKFGSQGQQKTYLIALRLAQYDWLKKHLNQSPVLLLDDIFDKLDLRRVSQLMDLITQEGFGQTLITETDGERLNQIFTKMGKSAKFFMVEDSKVLEYAAG